MTTARVAGRTLAEFEPLQPAEQKLLEHCRIGEFAVIAEERPTESRPDNTVRAAFLRFLLLGGDERTPMHEHPVQLQGAFICCVLDIAFTETSRGAACNRCLFSHAPIFNDSRIFGGLFLNGSQVPGLFGDRVVVAGPIFLKDQFKSTGEVQLSSAQISGDLSCSSATFNGDNGIALSIDGAAIKGNVFFNKQFKSIGSVRLRGTQIGGDLYCDEATFDGNADSAISADGAVIKGSVFFNKQFRTMGALRLIGVEIGGNLSCSSATFDSVASASLFFDGAVIKGSVFFDKQFKSTSEIRLPGATIGGNLSFSGATLFYF
jgi:hypothetical protein